MQDAPRVLALIDESIKNRIFIVSKCLPRTHLSIRKGRIVTL